MNHPSVIILLSLILIATNQAVIGQDVETIIPCATMIEDIEGNTYKTVQIGTQCWMAENLKTSKYRDGNPIPNVTDPSEWAKLSSGAWATYENSAANDVTYGKLYNWHAVVDARNVCPVDWHIPSNEEWTVLSNYIGTEIGFKMKSTSGWADNGNGSNTSGFNALPGGFRFNDGTFYYVSRAGFFWSSSESSSDYAWYRYLRFEDRDLGRFNYLKSFGLSVRCLRD